MSCSCMYIIRQAIYGKQRQITNTKHVNISRYELFMEYTHGTHSTLTLMHIHAYVHFLIFQTDGLLTELLSSPLSFNFIVSGSDKGKG